MNAANDSFFKVQRNRYLPIQSTLSMVPNYPDKLKIYKTHASLFWQVKCFHRGRLHSQSLKTEERGKAIFLAKEFFNQLMAKSYNLSAPQSLPHRLDYSFRTIAESMVAQERLKVTRGEIAKHSLTMLMNRLNKYLLPYFGDTQIADITNEEVSDFFNYLGNFHLSPMTLSQYAIAFRKVFNFALTKNIIRQIPLIPKFKSKSIPRGGFAVYEYLQIVRTAKLLSKLPVIDRRITHRNRRNGIFTETEKVPYEFFWLIGFMVNSFIRPVDVKLIQHKHIQVIRGDRIYLRLTLPETKLHRSQIVTLRPAVRIYEALKEYMSNKGCANSEDYLFLPEIKDREAAVYLMGKYFRKILEKANLRIGSLGQKRTLYSLRHTAITFRLLYGKGIDLLTLARNARTSVEMIERFYASNLTAEMNIDLLQSRR